MISIILPVYNGEKYIEKCIESVVDSGLKEYELIIIDDGSVDNTPNICDKIGAENPLIKVIHTINQGQGLARNEGIKLARGNYIAFLDADDTLEPDGLSYLSDFADNNDYDVISGTYYRVSHEKKEIIGNDFTEGVLSRNGDLEQIKRFHQMKSQSIFGYLWNKIYKKEFLIKNDLWVDDIRKVYMEDTVFNIRVFGKDPKYYHINRPVYCYNVQDDSTTRKYEPEIANKNVKMLETLFKGLVSENELEKSLDLLVPLAIRVFCWSIIRNVNYEGNSIKNKSKTIKNFTENQIFRKIILENKNSQQLKKLPSTMERLFYGGCIFCIKIKADWLLAFGFTIANPLMQRYINKNLK